MRPGATDPDLWRKVLYAGDRERVEPNLDHLRATGEPFTAEHRLATRVGQAKWLYHAAVMIRDPDGRPVCVEGILVDITARKDAERALLLGGDLVIDSALGRGTSISADLPLETSVREEAVWQSA